MPVDVLNQPDRSASPEIEKVFLEHHELVYRTAYRVTGNGTDAEDVLQTVFLRLVRAFPSSVVDGGWAAYLRRAAVNTSLDILRRRKRIVSSATELRIEEPRPGPYELQAGRELGARLRSALASMNPRAAEVFLLRHVEGYPNKDIARMLGTSAGSIAVTLFRARGHLRKSLRSFREGGV
jgi:RNA polymerase sigma-70 factor (ECF subfamily)